MARPEASDPLVLGVPAAGWALVAVVAAVTVAGAAPGLR